MNNRIHFAVKAVAFAKDGSTTYTTAKGVQSVGITTNFDLEQVFQLGQIEIYENIENIPNVEVTLEKVLDGYPLLYHLATRGPTDVTLVGRSSTKCGVALSLFNDTQSSASGTPIAEVNMSGLLWSNLSYTFPTDGNCTESITLIGNHKVWKSSNFTFTGGFLNNDVPLAVTSGLGGVQRRENIVFDAVTKTLLPTDIPGIASDGSNTKTNNVYGAHVRQITVSTDANRTDLNELGRKAPYFRYINFPVEVRCDIEIIAISGDGISATEEGVYAGGTNLQDRTIKIVTQDGTVLDLGTKNKLSSVSSTGGDTGGGEQIDTFSYLGFNLLSVTHPQMPT